MEQKDREKINLSCETVASKIDMRKLLPKLLENKVYNSDDTNMDRWNGTMSTLSTVKEIYLTIKTRGPYAFKNLLRSLRQSDHGNIADILEGKTSANNMSLNEACNFNGPICSDKPLTIKLCKATEFLDREYKIIERYPMRSKPRGLVLIISNIYYKSSEEPRFSAEQDTKNLQKLFEEMGFKVIVHENLTGMEIKKTVEIFSKREDLEKVDSCFVIITSHGTEDEQAEDEENSTEIQGIDYNANRQPHEKILCADLCDFFTAEACPQLAEKPKIFIFQLCRGKRKQIGVAHSRTTTDTSVIPNTNYKQSTPSNRPRLTTRKYSDTLVVYSTVPKHVSYRDKITGSWYIHILCDVFMQHACTTHILDLFTMIDAILKQIRATNDECQTSCIQSWGFNKHLYLNPGLFERNEEKETPSSH